MEKILKEILEELKFHSEQNKKTMEILTKLRQPCGDMSQFAEIEKMFNRLNLGNILKQAQEMGKAPK